MFDQIVFMSKHSSVQFNKMFKIFMGSHKHKFLMCGSLSKHILNIRIFRLEPTKINLNIFMAVRMIIMQNHIRIAHSFFSAVAWSRCELFHLCLSHYVATAAAHANSYEFNRRMKQARRHVYATNISREHNRILLLDSYGDVCLF